MGCRFRQGRDRLVSRSRSPWRAQVLEVYGLTCVASSIGPCTGRIEAHHVKYRSQGGEDDWRNGIPLCGHHHRLVHSRDVLISPAWLMTDALEYLAGIGWVDWDEHGEPFGRGWRSFGHAAVRRGIVVDP